MAGRKGLQIIMAKFNPGKFFREVGAERARVTWPTGRETAMTTVMVIIMTTLLGVGGALLAGYAGQLLGYYTLGEPVGFIASVVGALVILFLWTRLVNK